MNLYLLSQDYVNGYDTYDSFIIAAPSKGEAILISLARTNLNTWVTWGNHDKIDIKQIGVAMHDTKAGVILSSFNPG